MQFVQKNIALSLSLLKEINLAGQFEAVIWKLGCNLFILHKFEVIIFFYFVYIINKR